MPQTSEQSYERKHVPQTLGHWSRVKKDQSITLSEVQILLNRAFDEAMTVLEFSVAEMLDEVNEPLVSWLQQWDRTNYTKAEREEETFDYRLANLEEDMVNIDELIEQLGGEFRFAEL